MDWSELPTELLVLIAVNLTEFTDQIRFGCVCSGWRSAFQSLPLPPQIPWLLFPSSSSSNGFYTLSENRIYPLPRFVPSIAFLSGSPGGWLLALKRQNCTFIFLLMNPFTGASIYLPRPKPESSLSFLRVDTLVWDHSDSIVVVACTTRCGVFYSHIGNIHSLKNNRLQDELSWKQIKSTEHIKACRILFQKGKFYIHKLSELIVIDGKTLEVILVIQINSHVTGTQLVCATGESLLFLKYSGLNHSHDYHVYEMDLMKNEVNQREVKDIGDRAIFLDGCRCFSVDVDERSNLKRNCIYLAQSKIGRLSGTCTITVSVFDLTNGRRVRVGDALSEFCVEAPLSGEVQLPTWILSSWD